MRMKNTNHPVLPRSTSSPRHERGGDQRGNGGVLLIGNLQTGKTTLFNRLCGDRRRDIDIPESSLSVTGGELKARFREGILQRLVAHLAGDRHDGERSSVFDTPGTSTLFPQSEEELVVRDALLHLRPDALLLVADAKNVRRSLALAVHASELGLPMVLAVNMSDEASRQESG